MECSRTESAQGLSAIQEARTFLLNLGRNDLVRRLDEEIEKFDLSV